MRKAFRRFFTTLMIIAVLLGGAVWGLLAYIAPDEKLDMDYAPISVQDKALAVVKSLKTELVLSERDVNDLIKAQLTRSLAGRAVGLEGAGRSGSVAVAEGAEEAGSAAIAEAATGADLPMLNEDVRMDGAAFELESDKLIAHMNVTYKDRIPAQLDAVYRLEWQPPNIALRPQSLAVKDIALPLGLLEPVIIPLELPKQAPVSIKDVRFEQNQIRVLFKVNVKLPF